MEQVRREAAPVASPTAAVPFSREPSDSPLPPARNAPSSGSEHGSAIAQHVLDSLPDRTALIDREGRITTTNSAWRYHVESQGSAALPGANYLELLRASGTKWSREALVGIDAVLQGHLDNFEMEYEFNEYNNGQLSTRAYSTNVVPLLTEAGGAIVSQVDITWRKNLERQLSHRATHDGLTDLPNRMLLGDRLEQALARAARTNGRVAVLFCDLDRFKDINDTLGHAVGDQVLVAVARRLRRCCRRSDWVTRFGGDEFVVVMEDVPDQQVVADIAGRIKEAITAPVVIGDKELYFGISIGVALRHGTTRDLGEAVDDLLRDADTAMYRAKERGRNRIEVFDVEMRERATERLEMLPDLHRAVERGQIIAFFQPQFSIAQRDGSGEPGAEQVIGAEALVRWQHPTRGLLGPVAFLAMAEEIGIISTITDQVLEQSLTWLSDWLSIVPHNFRISVNVSPQELADPTLPQRVLQALRTHGIAPRRLCIEVTEGGLISNPQKAYRTMSDLSDLGVSLAVDDFGVGYSSLAYLNGYPVDVLKVDRSFVSAIGTNDRADALVRGIVELGDALGMATIAEGVETEAQLDCLRGTVATGYQGFLRSKAIPGELLTAYMRERLI